ncbi:MAG: hypothetical protein Q9170_006393 [Blastenia crenularia]
MTSRREGNQLHIPKLTYRNSPSALSISGNSVNTVGTDSSAASIFTCATSPPTSSYCGSPRSFQSSDGPLSPFCLDGASERSATSASLSPQSANQSKKKSSSFFKFLSVKEPSTQAFEAYQEQMKKRGTTQSGRANAVGLPGVSSAKLPPTVPKVNSKWDGVPQTNKEKAKTKDFPGRQSVFSSASRPLYTSRSTGSNMTTMTSSSTSSTSSTRSAPRANGKLKLDYTYGSLSDIYGWETGTPSNGSSTGSLQLESRETTNFAPTLSRSSSSLNLLLPPTLPEASCELSANTPPVLESSSTLSSPDILPALPSPLTPDSSVNFLSISPGFNAQSSNTLQEQSSVVNRGVIFTSSGTNVLGPPASANRKIKVNPPSTGEAAEVGLPAEAPNSILKRPALVSMDSWPLPPIPLEETPKRAPGKDAQSHTPASEPKSKMSHMISMFNKRT